jgi:hypothetical protein
LRKGDIAGATMQFERTLEIASGHPGARHNLAMIDEMTRKAQDGEIIRERAR